MSQTSFSTGEAKVVSGNSAIDMTTEREVAQQRIADSAFGADNPFGLKGITLDSGRLAGTTLSGAFSNERYGKILKHMQEQAKDPNNNQNTLHHVLALDKSVAPNIHFSCIIVAVQSKVNVEAGCGYQVLIVDGTNVPLQDMDVTTNNVNEKLSRFAEIVWDNDLQLLAAQRVLSTIPGTREGAIFFAAPVVIGEETNPDNERQLSDIMHNAQLAASTAVAMRAEGGRYFSDLKLAELVKNRRVPELYLSHAPSNSQVAPNQVGNVSRLSFVSKLQTGKPDRSSNSNYKPNSGTAAQVLMEVGTFTDLVPVLPTDGQGGFGQPQMYGMYGQPPAPLQPLTVMSVVRSQFSLTPAATELASVIVADQIRSNRWAEDFRHKGNQFTGGIDFADIGAILVNMPDPQNPGQLMRSLSAADPTFSDNHLWQLLGKYVKPTPMVAIDVPEADASSWYLGLYAALANRVPGAIKAHTAALDSLTNNKYSEILSMMPNKPEVFREEVYYMERGHWRMGDRIMPTELLDNYVAVCCYARHTNNPSLVAEYVDTITNKARSQVSRLASRRRIINEMSGNTAVFTRSVRRVIFTNEHRTVVNRAFNESGIVMHADDAIQFNLSGSVGYASTMANVQPIGANLNVAGGGGASNNAGTVNNYGWSI